MHRDRSPDAASQNRHGQCDHWDHSRSCDAAGQRIATTTLAYTPSSVTGYWDYYAGFVVIGWSPGHYQELRENYDYDGAGRVKAIRLTQGAGQLDFDPVTGLPVTAAPPAAAASGGVPARRSPTTCWGGS